MTKILSFIFLALLPIATFAQSINGASPNNGNAGQTLDVTITGISTNFDQGSNTLVNFGFSSGSSTCVNSITVNSATSLTANITIPTNTYTGDYSVSVTANNEYYTPLYNGFHVNGIAAPTLVSIAPESANAGQTLDVTITGSNTHFNQGSATALGFYFNQGSTTMIHVNSVTAIDAEHLTANISVSPNAASGHFDVVTNSATDGMLSLNLGFTVTGTQPLSGSVLPYGVTPSGSCYGMAQAHIEGGTLPYSYSFSDGSTSDFASNLCEGLQHLTVTDGMGASLTIDFVVGTPNNSTTTNNYGDSTVVASVFTDAIIDCIVDYANVDSAYIQSVSSLPNNEVSVVWGVVSNGTTINITEVYDVSYLTGVVSFYLQLYCPFKSTGKYLLASDQYYISKSGAINEIVRSTALVYPIPFQDELTIQLEKAMKTTVSIVDVMGKEVYHSTIEEDSMKINLAHLSAGQYILVLQNETGISTRKIVK